MQEGGEVRIATVEIHPQTFQSFSSSPLSVFVPRSLSLNRTVTYRHIYECGHTQSHVCVCGLIERSPALCRRLWLIGWSWRDEWQKKKKQRGTLLSRKKKKNTQKRPNIILPSCLLLRMTYIFYLLFLQNKLALWHGVTSKQSTSTLAAWSKGQDILL